MNLLSDYKAAAEAFFHERLEEAHVVELVTVLGMKKASSLKLLILCRPLSAFDSLANEACTLNLVSFKKGNRLKVNRIFAVDRLTDVTYDGSFDATLNFGASGLLSVSFESQIQREMFISALKRLSEANRRTISSNSQPVIQKGVDAIHGVLSEAFGAEVDADAASRVRKLRQEKRRVFSTEEEQHLLKFIREGSFDDIKGFQEALLTSKKKAELTSLEMLVSSAALWDAARSQAEDLVQNVVKLEDCIEHFFSNLLSKRRVIEQIEHANNALCCKQKNFKRLHVIMTELRDQLSLKPTTQVLLTRLRNEPDSSLVSFFSEDGNAEALSEAMRHMQQILQNSQLDADYPIAVVSERKAYFLEQRRMIAHRSRFYIFFVIDDYVKIYLADRSRYSEDNRVVWRLHTELCRKLLMLRDIIQALARIDMEGFASTLQKYRMGMQKVYRVEIYKYFRGLRKQIKKVNPSFGPFLLGSPENKIGVGPVSAEAGQTGGILCVGRGMPATSRTPSHGRSHGDGDVASNQTASEASDCGRDPMLFIEFPSLTVISGVVQYPNCSTRTQSDCSEDLSCIINCGRGHLRPDQTFAIALESTIACILHEESILSDCFGIVEAGTPVPAAPANAGSVRTPLICSTASSFSGIESSAPTGSSGGGGGARAPQRRQEDTDLFIESLGELFGADMAHIATEATATPTPAADGGDGFTLGGRLSVKPAVGLPPRYPVPPGTHALGDASGRHDRSREADGASALLNTGNEATLQALGSQAIHKIHSSFLVAELIGFTKFFAEKCDRIYSIAALCMIRAYYRNPNKPMAKSTFCRCLLRDLEAIVTNAIMRFVAEQTESINGCRRRYIIRPTALLHCFAKMPALILRMEEIHNFLSPEARDRTEYAAIATSLVDQSFDALDAITALKSAGCGSSINAGQDTKLSLIELLEKKVHNVIERMSGDENSTLKRNFIQQYRHHAFFCAFYVALPAGSYAAELLHEHYESSRVKRDWYGELYLTRVLFIKAFPVFGVFTISAEDLSTFRSKEELQHLRGLSVDALKKVLDRLEKELRTGVRLSAARMKRHFLRGVVPGSNEKSFHLTLLQCTWQQFSSLVLQKYDFLVNLLSWPSYQGLTAALTRSEVASLLSSF